VIFLFFAGFETTMNLISGACAMLSQRPADFARLGRDRALVAPAVEEFLRYDAPFQTTLRCTLEPIEVGGQRINKGRVIVLLLGSANHDERQFADPERLDLARSPNPHLSFGGGIHHCFGAALARLEARIVLDRLLDRFARLEPAGDVVRRARFRSYVHVPLVGVAGASGGADAPAPRSRRTAVAAPRRTAPDA
jgi:cytochrome P450